MGDKRRRIDTTNTIEFYNIILFLSVSSPVHAVYMVFYGTMFQAFSHVGRFISKRGEGIRRPRKKQQMKNVNNL